MNERFQYRSPTPGDVEELGSLGRITFIETFGHLYRPKDLKVYLDQTYSPEAIAGELADPLLSHQVVERDRQLVAFAKIGPLGLPVSSPPPKAGEIKQLYVLNAFAGKGIGRQLMAWALKTLKAASFEKHYLSVFSENHRAIRFYRNHGFEKCGEYDYPVGDHLDLEWIMVRSRIGGDDMS
jgi:ribosomal protein S18 acetylase RimI-like enzyme